MSAWLPDCVRQSWGTSGGSWTRQPAILCLHSTETKGFPSYQSGQVAPHFTIHLDTGERRQHISMAVAARALLNPSGGVQTNRGGAIQIEIIGTCDPNHRGEAGWVFVPDMNAEQRGHLSRLMRDICDDQGIRWDYNVTWEAYPGSAGIHNGVRLGATAWNTYQGILGHQHVPENFHGDPGNIPIDALLADPVTPAPTVKGEGQMILIHGKTPYLLNGGRLCLLSELSRANAVAAGVPQWGVNSEDWDEVVAAYGDGATQDVVIVGDETGGGGAPGVVDLAAIAKAVNDEAAARLQA